MRAGGGRYLCRAQKKRLVAHGAHKGVNHAAHRHAAQHLMIRQCCQQVCTSLLGVWGSHRLHLLWSLP
jgi:hypothetical protein